MGYHESYLLDMLFSGVQNIERTYPFENDAQTTLHSQRIFNHFSFTIGFYKSYLSDMLCADHCCFVREIFMDTLLKGDDVKVFRYMPTFCTYLVYISVKVFRLCWGTRIASFEWQKCLVMSIQWNNIHIWCCHKKSYALKLVMQSQAQQAYMRCMFGSVQASNLVSKINIL